MIARLFCAGIYRAVAFGALSALSTAALACTPPAAAAPDAYPTAGAYFSEVPNAFPDLLAYMSRLARETALIQDVVVVDVNCDGRPDVLVHMYANLDSAQRGSDTNAAVPNLLVALVQQPDGTFINQSSALFGVDGLDLGGLSSSTGVVVPNMTGDGYPGIAFQIDREDGRSGDGAHYASNTAQTAFLVSKGDGTYRLARVGTAEWNLHIGLAPVKNGNPDVVVSAGNGSAQAFRYQNGEVVSVSGYPPTLQGGSFLFFPPAGSAATSALVSSPTWVNANAVAQVVLGLQAKDASGQWSTVSVASPFSSVASAPFISWQGNQSVSNVMTYKGGSYAYPDFEAVCMIHRTPNANPTLVYRWNAFVLAASYQAGQTVDLRDPSLVQGNFMLGFDVSGQTITYRDLNISGEQPLVADNEIQCGDFNGDGYDDIVVRAMSAGSGAYNDGKPKIYLNDGTGNFSAFDSSQIPALPSAWMASGGSCQLAKIAGSGLDDIVCWNVNNFPGNSMRPVLFKALRPMPHAAGSPANVHAYAGDGVAVITFDKPAGATSALPPYRATSTDGSAVSAAASSAPIVVRGLANGTRYTFTVAGTNANASAPGPRSLASNPVTPSAGHSLVLPATADCLFTWAEARYPGLFSPAGASSSSDEQYYYRYYATTGDYLAVSFVDSHVWVLGGAFGSVPVDVGAALDFLPASGCH